MAAGRAIQTQAQTKEYDEGFDRIFGKDRKVKRGRTVYTQGGQPLPEPIEPGADWTEAEGRAQTVTEELVYGGIKATDGVPINSRKKHREYLKQNGLAMAQDYSPEYQQREAASRERRGDKERTEMVSRVAHKLFGG
jgi:nitrous oxide reductase accessory protein NosL